MARGHRQKSPKVGFLPCLDLALFAHLGRVPRHRHAPGGAAAELAGLDRVGERRAQDCPTDADAATRHMTGLRETLEPAGDVAAVETVDAHRADPSIDVSCRPVVLQSRLVADVDARLGPLRDDMSHSRSIGTHLTRGSKLGQQLAARSASNKTCRAGAAATCPTTHRSRRRGPPSDRVDAPPGARLVSRSWRPPRIRPPRVIGDRCSRA